MNLFTFVLVPFFLSIIKQLLFIIPNFLTCSRLNVTERANKCLLLLLSQEDYTVLVY